MIYIFESVQIYARVYISMSVFLAQASSHLVTHINICSDKDLLTRVLKSRADSYLDQNNLGLLKTFSLNDMCLPNT